MIARDQLTQVEKALRLMPAVALLGPRQVGKSTLARQIVDRSPGALWLDCERLDDRARIKQSNSLFHDARLKLLVLDEVQLIPDLFAQLRPEIDADRRTGRFLLLGSASGRLLQQTAESLAGRIAYVDLPPLLLHEVTRAKPAESPQDMTQQLWLRGGFPDSYLAVSEEASFFWRTAFVRTLIARDLAEMGVSAPAETMGRLWRMLAHLHGQPLNTRQLSLSLGGISHVTTGRYVDVLVDAMVLRRLPAFQVNLGKRLVKSPRIYVRDSGLLHTLLGLETAFDLSGHPVAGPSWEGFIIEQILGLWKAPPGAAMGYFRTSAGAEIDLVLENEAGETFGFEMKLSAAPALTKGFWQAKADLGLRRVFVVAPVREPYSIADDVDVIPPWALLDRMVALNLAHRLH